ncbi:MAG: DUF5662 family protein [Lachnospiraceae bacterium]|nr:DUF5662 family protein [Lachnospiraceae bacterium]
MHPIKHFLTITYHKFLVMQGCFGVGLYKQGLLHDLSKYSLSEFIVGAKYYQGDQSPNNMERRDKGYSSAWLHHKGRNKHHYEYWVDYSTKAVRGKVVPVEMPVKYVVEMMMDRIAASKVYNGNKYQDSFPLEYYLRGKENAPIHENTKMLLEKLLRILAEKGEQESYQYIKKFILNKKCKLGMFKKAYSRMEDRND